MESNANANERSKAKQYASDIKETKNMKITDLNNDCLEYIFMYLTEGELVKTATTNSRFTVPTKLAFHRKYGQHCIKLSNDNRWITDADVILVLQHFGDQMTKLHISIELGYFMDELGRLLDAIAENCGDNLIEIEFELCCHIWCRESPMSYKIGLKRIRPFLQLLHKKFKNLQRFEFHEYLPKRDSICMGNIIQHLPHLIQFSFDGLFSLQDVKHFIALNEQLEYLKLISKLSQNQLNYDSIALIDVKLPKLKCLEISGFNVKTIGKPERIHLHNLQTLITGGELFSVLFFPITHSLGNALSIEKVLQLNKLRTLSIKTGDWCWNLSQISNLIFYNRQLTNIEFTFDDSACDFWDLFEECFWSELMNGLDINKFLGIRRQFNGAQWQIECDEDNNSVSFNKVEN